jgi:hypothetical protein
MENVYDQFIGREQFCLNVDTEISSLVLNFHKLPETLLTELNVTDLTVILTNDLLKSRNEDSLFHFIAGRTRADPECCTLCGTVHFELLSSSPLDLMFGCELLFYDQPFVLRMSARGWLMWRSRQLEH